MAKQFAFNRPFWQCCAIECNEWIVAPTADIVNALRNQLLSGAAFAGEQYGSVVGGTGVGAGQPPHMPERRRCAVQVSQTVPPHQMAGAVAGTPENLELHISALGILAARLRKIAEFAGESMAKDSLQPVTRQEGRIAVLSPGLGFQVYRPA